MHYGIKVNFFILFASSFAARQALKLTFAFCLLSLSLCVQAAP